MALLCVIYSHNLGQLSGWILRDSFLLAPNNSHQPRLIISYTGTRYRRLLDIIPAAMLIDVPIPNHPVPPSEP